MWWIVFLTIFALGLIVKIYNWSNTLIKPNHKRNYINLYGYNDDHDGHDWNGHRWYDAYSLQG